MTVFRYTLMRLMRNKVNLLMVLVAPPLFIGMIFGLGNLGSAEITVGLVDLDNTPLTPMLADSLARTSPVVMLEEEEIKSALAGGKADCILVIDPGFTQEIIAGGEPRLRGYSIQEANLASRVKLQVEGFLGAVRGIAGVSREESDFYRGLSAYEAGSFALAVKPYQAESRVDSTMSGMGMLAMNMLLLSSFTSINLIKDRENRTFYRVMASPLRLKSYMIQSILCFLLILLVQVAMTFAVVRFIFGMDLGASVINLYLVMAVFALLCVAMGMALASLARTTQQAGTISTLIITPMSMLSGLFWPRAIMPEILQTIGKFLPATWMVEAADKVMMGNSLADAGMELAIILGYIVVFFLLGTWRRVEIAK